MSLGRTQNTSNDKSMVITAADYLPGARAYLEVAGK